MKIFRSLLFVALGAATSLVHAQTHSFRCRNDLANVGDAKSAVLQKCGEPMTRDSYCKAVQQSSSVPAPYGSIAPAVNVNVTQCVTVDEWTYNPGYGQFMTTLRFESGQLRSIEYGQRSK